MSALERLELLRCAEGLLFRTPWAGQVSRLRLVQMLGGLREWTAGRELIAMRCARRWRVTADVAYTAEAGSLQGISVAHFKASCTNKGAHGLNMKSCKFSLLFWKVMANSGCSLMDLVVVHSKMKCMASSTTPSVVTC
ncbi:hypothetical protein HaLaN_22335 [Haematococcus lacustris]|uniref:Uncharacterized protein n=1 Tax=Haematococcus lacustris TaxID=44745 RepID=A0A699ZRG2_HAELA|nr:hypothetical protein HaLaN_22335 [Haematococcus lacustris]